MKTMLYISIVLGLLQAFIYLTQHPHPFNQAASQALDCSGDRTHQSVAMITEQTQTNPCLYMSCGNFFR